MGNNVIVIRTVGCHNNGRHDDAEQLGKRFVDELKANGHSVLGAIVATGGAEINVNTTDGSQGTNVPGALKSDYEPGQCAPPARRAYERYMHSCGGLSWDGKPCPTWPELNEAVRGHWAAAVDHARPALVR